MVVAYNIQLNINHIGECCHKLHSEVTVFIKSILDAYVDKISYAKPHLQIQQ